MAEGRLSSVSLVEECLRRIDSEDAKLHAFVRVFHKSALKRAAFLDAERAVGHLRGPLHGIPVAIKDLADVEGDITGFGSRAYGDVAARSTAPFVKKLEDAGMIVIGKTHMVEFAFGSWGTNYALGTPRNPRGASEHFVPGGSSSGSAVAVAAGLVPAAIGSDTGGSVRIPAALCGIVGLKTTIGLVETRGVAPLSPTFDTIGPMTRHVEDARLILHAMVPESVRPGASGLPRIRVRWIGRSALEPLDDDVWALYNAALEKLRRHGLPTRALELPRSFADYQRDSGTIMAREAYLALRNIVEDPVTPLDPAVRGRVKQGAEITDGAVAALLAQRRAEAAEFRNVLSSHDVLVLPTTPHPAIPLHEVDESTFPMSRFTRFANYLDLCGLSIPCGNAGNGMPIGLQLISVGGAEDMVLSFAERLSM
jgi:aspartyl-tRNA(Asn)/glutamyl-tRNA(Gln) amidotransferase subunit A